MSDPFQVFIIGPMGKGKDNPGEPGTPTSQHMTVIEEVANELLPQMFDERQIVDVYSPLRGSSDIIEYVFNQIDGADIGIADISGRSPSVMYELAYFHALGTPVIILDLEKQREEGIPFYLQGSKIFGLDDFSKEQVRTALDQAFTDFLNENDDQDFTQNPISKFYSAPLVEAAGAATIARGYFTNMVRAIADTSGGVKNKYPELNIKEFAIIEPSEDFDINGDMADIGRITREWNRGEKLKEEKWDIDVAGKERKVSGLFIDGVIYDYPRTVGALDESPRLVRVAKGRSRTRSNVSGEKIELTRKRVASRLVRFFREVLEDEIASNSKTLFARQIKFITIQEFADRLNVKYPFD
ncbi:nucleoside 2-deoxyribosyltransferase [Nereida sp. MMG025]|uniref:nucleoside 2-deoxyribosyltransferase n=1 Tax=Nereida sp. MMG025 TaxID=2909981 RepID=UPI001F1785EE|nr:nucleoside 2-deoxyribosyltransferase [Nereida sp. MMG025]MCF6444502.1 nucleoside 2-deoxyribosyltransferase [Nereida sp. MMG025]